MGVTVLILKASNLHNTSIFGEQKVYCQVRIGMMQERTEHRHGCNPHFGDALQFPGMLQAQQLEVELWADHITGANLVGRGMLLLTGAEMQGNMTAVIPLFEQNGKQKGELGVSVMMTPF